MLARWRSYLEQHARPDDPVFGPWHDLMNLPDADFAAHASAVVGDGAKVARAINRHSVQRTCLPGADRVAFGGAFGVLPITRFSATK